MELLKFKITRIEILKFYYFTTACRVYIIALSVLYVIAGFSVQCVKSNCSIAVQYLVK